MISTADLNLLLSRLAERFENSAQLWPGDGRGWGQFLDAPRGHTQIGPYGTCAGLIVLSLAGRGQSPICRSAAELLVGWWAQREQEHYPQKRFAQTLRLAVLVLALRTSDLPELTDIREEAEAALFGRCLPSGGWGDWWLGPNNYDATPRLVTSSMAVLSILLFRPAPLSERYSAAIAQAIEFLWNSVTSSGHFSHLERALAVTAITLWESFRPTSARRIVPNSTWRPAFEPDHGIYFFFYEHSPDREGKRVGRDYLLIPLELLIGISGLQKISTASHRIAATEVLDRVASGLRSEGFYLIGRRDYVSTLDQCWVAIFLAQTIASRRTGIGPPGLLPRVWYALVKQREGNAWTDVILPIFAVLLLVVANAMPGNEEVVPNIIVSVCTLVVAAIYGDDVLRRLIPGKV